MNVYNDPERNTYLQDLAQSRTADFVSGLEVGRDFAAEFTLHDTPVEVAVNLVGGVAVRSGEFRDLSRSIEGTFDFKGYTALVEGLREGIEFSLIRQKERSQV